jgi:hypothetical protein
MTILFSSFASVCLAILVVSGHILAQRLRGDVAVATSRLRMPSGGASDVA